MVKVTPKIQVRKTRKRKFFDYLYINKPINTDPNHHHHHLPPFTPQTAINKPQETPLTRKKIRSRSPLSTASSTYATCSSSSTPVSPSSLSSPPPFLDSKSPPLLSFLGSKLPHSCFLKRTVSDFEDCSSSKKKRMLKKEINKFSSQLPPLPPPPSPNLLWRTFSDPIPVLPSNNTCSFCKKEDEKVKMEEEEEEVKVEKLSMDLSLIKFKCGCGSYTRLLFSNSETKWYKLT